MTECARVTLFTAVNLSWHSATMNRQPTHDLTSPSLGTLASTCSISLQFTARETLNPPHSKGNVAGEGLG